jgi:anti-sigma regulatory factor (Ser/Thr protein kinase)
MRDLKELGVSVSTHMAILEDGTVKALREKVYANRGPARVVDLSIDGPLEVDKFHPLLAEINERAKHGHKHLRLNFARCSAAFAGPMLALCAQIAKLRDTGVKTEIVLPDDPKLQTLFRNTNWAHILDPVNHEQSRFKGTSHVPVTQYRSAAEQQEAVNAIMNALLSSLSDLTRLDLAAIEWSINEITDNVINHSHSAIGGFVQLTTFTKRSRRVEYAVCDPGIGIPNSLRQTHPELTSDAAALDRAIREGVTRDIAVGQGNGLFGSFEICRISEGFFEVHSGYARLSQNKSTGLHIRQEQTPYLGTLVVGSIDYSKPQILGKALKFGNKPHVFIDYIELKYESKDGKRIVVMVSKEAESFGSREAAKPVKKKLQTLATLCPEKKIFIDFSDIPLISSSFADEALGKLFLELGPIIFMALPGSPWVGGKGSMVFQGGNDHARHRAVSIPAGPAVAVDRQPRELGRHRAAG